MSKSPLRFKKVPDFLLEEYKETKYTLGILICILVLATVFYTGAIAGTIKQKVFIHTSLMIFFLVCTYIPYCCTIRGVYKEFILLRKKLQNQDF
jgi:amino acid permease